MPFESLSERIQMSVRRLTGRAVLTEKDIDDMMREVRLSLLEADVNYKVVKEPITFSNETYYVGKGSVCQKLKKTGYYKTVKKSFASSNKKIATVDKAGNIKGVAPGTTTITMKMGGAVNTVNVVVYQLSGLNVHIEIGTQFRKQ